MAEGAVVPTRICSGTRLGLCAVAEVSQIVSNIVLAINIRPMACPTIPRGRVIGVRRSTRLAQ
jgi:hypothetical protein